MTDRVRSLTVVLDDDYRTDDCEIIIAAIGMIRGVQSVAFTELVNGNDHLNREVAKMELRAQLYELLK